MVQLVIHADDVGMCHGANRAFVELSHLGTITSGSVMVPCPAEEAIGSAAADARAAGMPVFDLVLETDFSRPPHQPADYKAMLSGLSDKVSGDGLVFCAFHPNAPGGAEVEVIEPDTFHVRTDEYELFGTDGWEHWLTSQPYDLASMADLA